MTKEYDIHCDCGAVKVRLSGKPKVCAYCHCQACRELVQVPFHSVTAWDPSNIEVIEGVDELAKFQHPEKEMTRAFCKNCGDIIFNTNTLGWMLVSQLLIRKCYSNKLPQELAPKVHLFYSSHIIDIDDDLPKQD